MEKTVNITNFIGTYDGYITKEDCNKAIKLFNKQHEFNKTINRQQFEQVPVNEKQDQQFFATSENINIWHSELKSLIVNFDMALKHYENTTGIKTSYGVDEFHLLHYPYPK